ERCSPGTSLGQAALTAEDALSAAADVLRRLWRPAPVGSPFERVGDVTPDWAGLVRARMGRHRPALDPGLVALGADLLESLPRSATDEVVVHGDFNPTNLLAAERQPWLAIDAKPMVGDPGYDPA